MVDGGAGLIPIIEGVFVDAPSAYSIRTANTSSNGWGIQEEVTHTLDCAQGMAVAAPVAFAATDYKEGKFDSVDTAGPLTTSADRTRSAPIIATAGALCAHTYSGGSGGRPDMATQGYFQPSGMAVRRLTPEECEALQGFPRGYTQVPVRGKPAADGPRYKALGNSMAVPCMAFIGRRIEAVRAILAEHAA